MGGMSEPVSARSHVAVVQEQQDGSWWALFTAWIKGVRRGR